jgi:hypothetical protein
MHLTKIVVLVAHNGSLDVDDFCDTISYGIGQQLEERRHTEVFYEVRDGGTKEVTLGSIDWSLEEREPLEEVSEPEAVTSK